jgi:hypothetical protein
LFDPQTIGALNKLAKVAERAKQSGKVENHSNTGSIAIGLMNIGAATGLANSPLLAASGHGTAAAASVLSALSVGLSQAGGAKLLASPAFARRLASMPLNPAAAAKYWSSKQVMGNLIRSEPMLASELQAFQRAVNDNLVRGAAASPDSDEKQKQQQPY